MSTCYPTSNTSLLHIQRNQLPFSHSLLAPAWLKWFQHQEHPQTFDALLPVSDPQHAWKKSTMLNPNQLAIDLVVFALASRFAFLYQKPLCFVARLQAFTLAFHTPVGYKLPSFACTVFSLPPIETVASSAICPAPMVPIAIKPLPAEHVVALHSWPRQKPAQGHNPCRSPQPKWIPQHHRCSNCNRHCNKHAVWDKATRHWQPHSNMLLKKGALNLKNAS